MEISRELTDAVKHSYKRCCERQDFFDIFYGYFLKQSDEIAAMFAQTNWYKQKHLIEHGIRSAIFYVENPDASVARKHMVEIAGRHGKQELNVNPKFYPLWLESLLKAIKQCDPEYSEELKRAWEEVFAPVIRLMIAKYKSSDME